jgi:hypothetical protein
LCLCRMATCNPIWETTYDFPIGRVAYVSVSPGRSKTFLVVKDLFFS